MTTPAHLVSEHARDVGLQLLRTAKIIAEFAGDCIDAADKLLSLAAVNAPPAAAELITEASPANQRGVPNAGEVLRSNEPHG